MPKYCIVNAAGAAKIDTRRAPSVISYYEYQITIDTLQNQNPIYEKRYSEFRTKECSGYWSGELVMVIAANIRAQIQQIVDGL